MRKRYLIGDCKLTGHTDRFSTDHYKLGAMASGDERRPLCLHLNTSGTFKATHFPAPCWPRFRFPTRCFKGRFQHTRGRFELAFPVAAPKYPFPNEAARLYTQQCRGTPKHLPDPSEATYTDAKRMSPHRQSPSTALSIPTELASSRNIQTRPYFSQT